MTTLAPPRKKNRASLANLTFTEAAPTPLVVHHVHGPGCDHDHGHAEERPPATRPCGSEPAIQLDLAYLLPGESDEVGRFEEVAREVKRLAGVTGAHLRRDAGGPELCIHLDPAVVEPLALTGPARDVVLRAAKRYVAQTWFVRGMDSAQCGAVIEHVLRRTPGVLSADVAYAAERLIVEWDNHVVTAAAIDRKVDAMGYTLEVPEAGHACSHHAHSGGLAPAYEVHLTAAAGALIALGLIAPYASVDGTVTAGLFAMALMCAGFYPARDAFTAIRAGRVDIHTLMVVAAIGAGLLGAWFEGAFLLFLFTLGHTLEHRALDQARRAVESLGRLRPEVARVRRGEDVAEVPVGQVRRGDVIVVRPGDRVPLDGVVVSGASHVDQAPITGESVPVPKSAGEHVFAGTLNTDGALDVRVTKLSTESALARVVDLVSQAEARKGPAQRFTARIERVFVPIVLAGAPAFAALLWTLGTPPTEAVLRGLSVLVAASPCALALATPAAVLSAVARAAREGVLVKGGAHLEALGAAQVVAFDKTGTLTLGRPRLTDVVVLEGAEVDVLEPAASAEALSAHPIAVAILEGCRARGIDAPAADQVEAVHGKGLVARCGERRVEVGSEGLFDVVPPGAAAAAAELRARGRTVALVRVDGRFVGALGVADTTRPEAAPVVRALGELGVAHTALLSGDHAVVANAVAIELGLDEARGALLPEDKVRAVRDLARHGPVVMVGDGVNDAPALAAAAVGVAMGGAASDTALETADVVLMGGDLTKLPFAVALARTANLVVRQNIAVALGVAVVLVIASIAGWVQIAHAVVLHEGSTLLVAANGLRLLGWRGPARAALG